MGRSYTSRNSNSKAVHTHHEATVPLNNQSIYLSIISLEYNENNTDSIYSVL